MNLWKDALLQEHDSDAPLYEQLQHLFAEQRASWDLFRKGEAALLQVTTQRFTHNGYDVIVQANPGRTISTNAKVDAASIAKRPCFLCPKSLPAEERGIAFGKYIILPNPFPILPFHVTIALREHVPQSLLPRLGDILNIAESFGPEMFVLYNGPKCGASAPDHMHFQACSSRDVPLFAQWPESAEDSIIPLTMWNRHCLAGTFSRAVDATIALQTIHGTMQRIVKSCEEPMLNLLVTHREGRFLIAVFPRAKPRSSRYFASDDSHLSISHAAVEMGGIIVVADPAHFSIVDEAAILSMYREVTLDSVLFKQLARDIV